jgi:hypothetical protein
VRPFDFRAAFLSSPEVEQEMDDEVDVEIEVFVSSIE